MRTIHLIAMFAIAVPAFATAQTADFSPPPGTSNTTGTSQPSLPPTGQDQSFHHQGGQGRVNHHAAWQQKFNLANTTHDGRLTLSQAEAANLRPIVQHFSEIDTSHRGYVTFNEIEAWHYQRMSQKYAQQAQQLRTQN